MTSKREEGATHDVARLRGARLAASESDDGRALAEAKVKDLTGDAGGARVPADSPGCTRPFHGSHPFILNR